jgi:hypothetical protein
MLALNYAMQSKVKTLYISPDTSHGDMVSRVCQILDGSYRSVVEAKLEEGPEHYPEFYAKLDRLSHIDFYFRTSIQLNDIRQMMFAYLTKHGDWPELVVVDNLVNLIVDQSSPAEWQMTAQDLDDMAKETQSCMLILTHVAGAKENGDQPLGLSDILYKVTKAASLVLTLTLPDMQPNRILLACVKNRNGESDKSGKRRYELIVQPELCRIWDPVLHTAGTAVEFQEPVTPGPARPDLDRIRAFMAEQDA